MMMEETKGRKIILVYKRTHTGDPDCRGIFGINTCMGEVRDRHYDAVIGIGGKSYEPRKERIAEKVNWIGIGKKPVPLPKGHPKHDKGTKVIEFDHFLLLDEEGQNLKEHYPLLHKHMLDINRRTIMSNNMNVSDDLYNELTKILDLAREAPPSLGLGIEKSSQLKSYREPRSCTPVC